MAGDGVEAAAIDEAEHVVLGDFLHEADAARAEDAALGIERDARPELDVFRLLTLCSRKRDSRMAVFDGKLLQAALARPGRRSGNRAGD